MQNDQGFSLPPDLVGGDYGAETVFTRELAADGVAAATTFCATARQLLVSEGWLSE